MRAYWQLNCFRVAVIQDARPWVEFFDRRGEVQVALIRVKSLGRAGGQGLELARTTFSASLSKISIDSKPASLSKPTHCVTDSPSPMRF